MFNNGIFNEEDKALANASKQSSDTANDQGVYAILNPYTGNPVAELLYAAYDKLNDLAGGRLPLTAAERTNQAIFEYARNNGGTVDSNNHSRGGMTFVNAIGDLQNNGIKGVAIGNAYFNGSAANVQEAARLVDAITDGKGRVWNSNHATDLVGGWIGGNPATGEKNDGSFPSSHRSYAGYLPPEFGSDGLDNPVRDDTDRAWGEDKYNEPVLVQPKGKSEP